MRPVVLVHGLWHDPGHFDLVAGPLRAAGTVVVVPQLHRGSLEADTAAVQAAVDALPEPPLVLGHSYGGSVITGLTGAGHLVYLAAFVPDEGESAAGLSRATHLIGPAVQPLPGGSTRLDPAAAATAMYEGCAPDRAAWAVGLLRAQAPGCGRGIPTRQAWRTIPSTYVVCARDLAVDPDLQRTMAGRCTTTVTWETGHAPFVTDPELVVDLVAGPATP
jgi:pimeloyl-ACP methyl ester carboxylesterase